MAELFGDWVWPMAVLSGALVAGGLAAVVIGAMRQPVRLGDALAHLDAQASPSSEQSAPSTAWDERFGSWVLRRVRLPLSDQTRTTLKLQGRSVADFAVEKAALALIGLMTPLLFVALAAALGLGVGVVPLGASLVLALVGWFVPDLRLRQAAPRLRAGAGEALCTFVDLVTLERLANQSTTQALHSAAQVSQIPLFTSLATALERARLEQRPAWQALRTVGDELDLPQLRDLADVLRLDEHGAALGSVLRARAEELRDAQLMHDKVKAQEVSESLTLWMAVPAMIFGLIFLIPPLLRLVAT